MEILRKEGWGKKIEEESNIPRLAPMCWAPRIFSRLSACSVRSRKTIRDANGANDVVGARSDGGAGQAVPLRESAEFDAFAHGSDAFGADADLIAEGPFERARLCAAARSRSDCAGAADEATSRC